MKKIHLNLYVNKDIVDKAKEYGFNLSKFLENQLQGYFNFIEKQKDQFFPYYDNQKSRINNSQDTPVNSKSNNTFFDNDTYSGARGVAWHPSTLGW